MSYFNRIIGLGEKTTTMLEKLESFGCDKVRIPHNPDGTIPANFCILPTYADVIDFLMHQGYTIHIEPCSTFASANHNAWWWVLNVYNVDDAYEKKEYSDTDMYCQWHECANAAINKALSILETEHF